MDSVEKYLPEPQSLKAVLKLDDNVCIAWLHAIRMEIKNLIDHCTFILGETPHKNEVIIPVKLVLKAKQTATGKLDKLKARVVARVIVASTTQHNTVIQFGHIQWHVMQ
jgi:hypothetical protein